MLSATLRVRVDLGCSTALAGTAIRAAGGTFTLTGGTPEGLIGGLTLAPESTGAFTVAAAQLHQAHRPRAYIFAAVTDACALYFDGASGTHKALDLRYDENSPGAVTAWVKVNLNGTVDYMSAYSSKTS